MILSAGDGYENLSENVQLTSEVYQVSSSLLTLPARSSFVSSPAAVRRNHEPQPLALLARCYTAPTQPKVNLTDEEIMEIEVYILWYGLTLQIVLLDSYVPVYRLRYRKLHQKHKHTSSQVDHEESRYLHVSLPCPLCSASRHQQFSTTTLQLRSAHAYPYNYDRTRRLSLKTPCQRSEGEAGCTAYLYSHNAVHPRGDGIKRGPRRDRIDQHECRAFAYAKTLCQSSRCESRKAFLSCTDDLIAPAPVLRLDVIQQIDDLVLPIHDTVIASPRHQPMHGVNLIARTTNKIFNLNNLVEFKYVIYNIEKGERSTRICCRVTRARGRHCGPVGWRCWSRN